MDEKLRKQCANCCYWTPTVSVGHHTDTVCCSNAVIGECEIEMESKTFDYRCPRWQAKKVSASQEIEPQQPEGELVPNPYQWALAQYTTNNDTYGDSVLMGRGFKLGSEAQHAHDKARMVKLPSEDELVQMLIKTCELDRSHPKTYVKRAKAPLKLLKGEQKP